MNGITVSRVLSVHLHVYIVMVVMKPGSEYFVFMLSTRAGGLGINLYTADVVAAVSMKICKRDCERC